MTASFLTGDSYLGNIREPLTRNRYNYCISSYLNYVDPSGHRLIPQDARDEIQKLVGRDYYIPRMPGSREKLLDALGLNGFHLEMPPSMREGKTIPPMWTPTYGVEREENGA